MKTCAVVYNFDKSILRAYTISFKSAEFAYEKLVTAQVGGAYFIVL